MNNLPENYKNKNDHDLLIHLVGETLHIREMLQNHLKHHWQITAGLVVALGAALVALLFK